MGAKVSSLSQEASRCAKLDSENKELRTKIASMGETASLLTLPEDTLPNVVSAALDLVPELSLGNGSADKAESKTSSPSPSPEKKNGEAKAKEAAAEEDAKA